ncbi:hypothetical protein QVD17_20244 [Tagetes erecta]|uniref:Uncharacterized protein n=1 Tax=Tagetes erecta TaxID=13708 RepID=A0AAD8KLC3_TARER|nr:hypothetical protein QVD17_20244 [Tagetes erecta]
MDDCKPCATPIDTTSTISVTDGALLPHRTLYKTLAGTLQYLTLTCPDITYAVQQIMGYLLLHRPHHLLRIVLMLIEGVTNSRRSTSGYCAFLTTNLISWFSKRHATISRSNDEAKYRGVANVVYETTWLHDLLFELHVRIPRAIIVCCDNVSEVYLYHDPVQHQHTKHAEVDIHFVREKVRVGHIRVLPVPSSAQYGDIFTKDLPCHLFVVSRFQI